MISDELNELRRSADLTGSGCPPRNMGEFGRLLTKALEELIDLRSSDRDQFKLCQSCRREIEETVE